MSVTLYCNSLVEYSRFRTREVMIGDVGVGGDNPIRIQSITTTDTVLSGATIIYTPNPNYSGSDSFDFKVFNKT